MTKKSLSESDICNKLTRPTFEATGLNGMDQIYREFPLRAGRVVVRGQKAQRDKSTVLRADYALFYKANIPLLLVEAYDIKHAVGAGNCVKELRALCAEVKQRLCDQRSTHTYLAGAVLSAG